MALKINDEIQYRKGEELGVSSDTYVVIEEFYCNKKGEVELPVRYFKSQTERNEENGWDKNKVQNLLPKKFTYQLTEQELIEGFSMNQCYQKVKTSFEANYSVENI